MLGKQLKLATLSLGMKVWTAGEMETLGAVCMDRDAWVILNCVTMGGFITEMPFSLNAGLKE